ncbi:MAG: twin-arginine translocase TatA/TatE family subunit [Chloroflexi bacterium HGW-Chloroflexi-4]|jgi:sec-independent protein translocase protein TatA|nr:MAG: twin-arginine translocase TatA/TatE family subunit [Chloroflexi bacterium HGW-Chloroflexi-4]
MPFRIGLPELLILLVIIVLIFGVGRVSKIGGELGGAIRSFRKGLKDNDDTAEKKNEIDAKDDK